MKKSFLTIISTIIVVSVNTQCVLGQNSAAEYNDKGMEYYCKVGNYTKAFEMFQQAANMGLKEAQYNLGVCYEKGNGVKKNDTKAIEWYTKSADQWSNNARLRLEEYHLKYNWLAQNTKRNTQKGDSLRNIGKYDEAVKWYEIAARRGDATAQFNLAGCYANGQGVTQDYEKAFELLAQAAEQGQAFAQADLGFCYENGIGVSKNIIDAAKWYQKAADQGHTNSQFKIGMFYCTGEVEEAREQEIEMVKLLGLEYYTSSTPNGNDNPHEILLTNSKFNIYVDILNEGRFTIPQNFSEAAVWFQKAADHGHAEAQLALWHFYSKGYGVEEDIYKAVVFLSKSANLGNAEAQYNLALCYLNGTGLTQSSSEAKKWLETAAAQGYKPAINKLNEIK